MTNLKDLLAQKASLEMKIEEARQQQLASAIAQVRALVDENGLTAADIFGTVKSKAKSGAATKTPSKVAAKYRDPATGSTWTGRGKAPKWIDGKDRSAFAID
jgi:DNA-binding protein H-NS